MSEISKNDLLKKIKTGKLESLGEKDIKPLLKIALEKSDESNKSEIKKLLDMNDTGSEEFSNKLAMLIEKLIADFQKKIDDFDDFDDFLKKHSSSSLSSKKGGSRKISKKKNRKVYKKGSKKGNRKSYKNFYKKGGQIPPLNLLILMEIDSVKLLLLLAILFVVFSGQSRIRDFAYEISEEIRELEKKLVRLSEQLEYNPAVNHSTSAVYLAHKTGKTWGEYDHEKQEKLLDEMHRISLRLKELRDKLRTLRHRL